MSLGDNSEGKKCVFLRVQCVVCRVLGTIDISKLSLQRNEREEKKKRHFIVTLTNIVCRRHISWVCVWRLDAMESASVKCEVWSVAVVTLETLVSGPCWVDLVGVTCWVLLVVVFSCGERRAEREKQSVRSKVQRQCFQ